SARKLSHFIVRRVDGGAKCGTPFAIGTGWHRNRRDNQLLHSGLSRQVVQALKLPSNLEPVLAERALVHWAYNVKVTQGFSDQFNRSGLPLLLHEHGLSRPVDLRTPRCAEPCKLRRRIEELKIDHPYIELADDFVLEPSDRLKQRIGRN